MAKRNRASARKRRSERAKDQKQKMIVQVGAIAVGLFVFGMIFFFAFRAGNGGPPQPLERLELDPIRGNPDAPVTLVEYGAFGCEACRSLHESGFIDNLLTQYNGQVNLVFRDFPLILGAWDQEMGEVAQCALDQSNDLFWVAHDTLYEDTILGRTTQSGAIDLIANENSAMDIDALRTCVTENTHFHTVRFDLERPQAQFIRGTPTFFVNGQQVTQLSESVLTQMIDNALAQ